MLSIETERQLARLLFEIAESEMRVESSRQSLTSVPDFNPYAAFSKLDRDSVRQLSAFDLRELLSDKGLPWSMNSLKMLIRQYDSHNEEALSLVDFFRLVLPSENSILRDEAEKRMSYYLSPRVELLLAQHVQLEIQEQNVIEQEKKALNNQLDFSARGAFWTIDRANSNFICVNQLIEFLNKYQFRPTQSHINAIIRRIDTNGEMKLSLEDFIQGISSSAYSDDSTYREKIPISYHKNTPREHTIKKSLISSFEASEYAERFSSYNTIKSNDLYCDQKQRPQFSNSCIKEMIDLMEAQIRLLKDIEDMKNLMAIQSDFTLKDFFRLADRDYKGWINSRELIHFLDHLKISHRSSDVILLIKENSSTKILRFEDFKALWMPKDQNFSRVLKRRSLLIGKETCSISSLTISKIKRTLELYIEGNRQIEDLRKKLFTKINQNLKSVFDAIDDDKKGFICPKNLINALRKSGIYTSFYEIDLLFEKYDKNLDGKISFNEFVQETTPTFQEASLF